MNLCVIGCGGIGSWFCLLLDRLIEHQQLGSDMDIKVYDMDIVEKKNLRHQLFDEQEIGMPKAAVMALRHSNMLPVIKRFDDKDLHKFDYFIICADNNAVRNLVYEHVLVTNEGLEPGHKGRKKFIDMRCEGRDYIVLTYRCNREMLFCTLGDTKESTQGFSCQRAEDVVRSQIKLGNMAVAPVGAQILLDDFRGVEIPEYIYSGVVPNHWPKEI